MSNTINKPALVAELQLFNIFDNKSKKEVTEFVEDFFELVASHVSKGDKVTIPNFGTFTKYEKTNGAFKPKFSPFTAFKERVSA